MTDVNRRREHHAVGIQHLFDDHTPVVVSGAILFPPQNAHVTPQALLQIYFIEHQYLKIDIGVFFFNGIEYGIAVASAGAAANREYFHSTLPKNQLASSKNIAPEKREFEADIGRPLQPLNTG
jgi:hypothetical protein